jgi:hypothetical protein
MLKRLFLLAVLPLLAVYSCGGSDSHDTPSPGSAGDSTPDGGRESNLGGSGSLGLSGANEGGTGAPAGGRGGGDGGATSLAGSPSATGGDPQASTGGAPTAGAGNDAGAGGAPVVLDDGLIVNVPYTCASPFDGVMFGSYFYLEDFEDGALSTPGVTSSSTTPSSSFGVPNLIDSVDCDDGVVDGTCLDCDALFANGTVELTFDAQTLGSLPTHVGLVWTDGGYATSVTITGYDTADDVIYSQKVDGIGDDSNYNTTAEDRFFGIVHYAGVQRVVVSNSSGGLEIDHLQYGR